MVKFSRTSFKFTLFLLVFFVVYFLFSFSQYYQVWENNQSVMVSLFIMIDYIATVLPFGLSVLYHTFMCHKGGKPVYQRMLRVDVAGIWLLATFGELQNIYVTLYFYHILRIAGEIPFLNMSPTLSFIFRYCILRMSLNVNIFQLNIGQRQENEVDFIYHSVHISHLIPHNKTLPLWLWPQTPLLHPVRSV